MITHFCLADWNAGHRDECTTCWGAIGDRARADLPERVMSLDVEFTPKFKREQAEARAVYDYRLAVNGVPRLIGGSGVTIDELRQNLTDQLLGRAVSDVDA